MSVEVQIDGQKHVASGTLFGNNMPRLIRLDDYRLEAYIDGNLLVFTHADVPGIIGAVGTIFGKHKVNIGQMTVGRAAPGGIAVGILNLPAAGKLPGWLGW
jgi:D-3-phosphoglycerate dehydrogenase